MNFWDTFNLMQLPLSAYTPGQGDPKMEGGFETASGHPVYTFEAWRQGKAPYVTGATNQKNPSGALVYRQVGDHNVPVRITDYGPGVKGIDIASSNSEWATNFPYHGARDNWQPPGEQTPMVAANTAGASRGSNLSQMSTLYDYSKMLGQTTGQQVGAAAGNSLKAAGEGIKADALQGMQQATAMLARRPDAANALRSLAADPLQFLRLLQQQGAI